MNDIRLVYEIRLSATTSNIYDNSFVHNKSSLKRHSVSRLYLHFKLKYIRANI